MLGQYATETDLVVGDRVFLIREPECIGVISVVEENRLSVMVRWDDCPDGDDFQWSNKVTKLEGG